MTEIITARFQSGGKEYYFNPNGLTIVPGQGVILSTTHGEEYGECTVGNHAIDEKELTAPLRPVVRLATQQDEKNRREKADKERRALTICRQKVAEHKLEMSLTSAHYSFDGTKLLVYFTADDRVDFRALVRDLAATFHVRIELRQIGVRDETKMLGGLGICGQPYCCSRFLDKFQPVSIKMAKTQGLSLNPTKISGSCGRLMCCLKYEQGAYEDAVKRCPKKESFVETPDGVGTVTEVNLLREKVKVRMEDGGEVPKQYWNQEIRVVRSGKGKRPEDYVMPPKSELEKLRFVPLEEEKPAQPAQSELAAALEEIFDHEEKRQPIRKGKNYGGNRNNRRPAPGKNPNPKPQGNKAPGEGPKAPGKSGGNAPQSGLRAQSKPNKGRRSFRPSRKKGNPGKNEG